MAIHRGNTISVSRHYLSGEGGWQISGAAGSLASPDLGAINGPLTGGTNATRFMIGRDSVWHQFASDGTDIKHSWRRDRGVAISGPAAETVLTGGGSYSSMAIDWGQGKDGAAMLAAWEDTAHDWQVAGISSSNGVSGWTAAALQPLATECMPLAGLARDTDGSYWFAYSDYSAAGTGAFRVKRAKSLSADGVGTWSSVAVPVPVMAVPAEVTGVCNVIGAGVYVLRQGLLLFIVFHWFDFAIGGFRFLCSRLVATYDDADPEVLTWSDLKWTPGFDYLIMQIGTPQPADFPDALANGRWPAFGAYQGRDGRIDWVTQSAGGSASLNKWKRLSKDGTASPDFG